MAVVVVMMMIFVPRLKISFLLCLVAWRNA